MEKHSEETRGWEDMGSHRLGEEGHVAGPGEETAAKEGET